MTDGGERVKGHIDLQGVLSVIKLGHGHANIRYMQKHSNLPNYGEVDG